MSGFSRDSKANSGATQKLLTYGRLLSKMSLNTHFVIVWDCDADYKASEDLQKELPGEC